MVEEGPHERLLDAKGLYTTLHQAQILEERVKPVQPSESLVLT